MQEADGRGVSSRQDRRFGQSVETRSRLTQAAIGQIRATPVTGVVTTSLPSDTVLPGQYFIESLDPGAFDTTKLIDGTSLGGGLPEAHAVHFANDLEAGVGIEGESRLVEQAVGSGTTGLTSRVEAHSSLANPHQKTTYARCECDSRMRYPCTGLEHEASDAPNRDMRAHPIAIDYDEGSIENIEPPFLDKQNGGAILDGDRTGRCDSRRGGHGGRALRAGHGVTER